MMRSAAVVALTILLTACTTVATSPAPTAPPTAPSPSPAPPEPSVSPAPKPTRDLGAFDCPLPVSMPATTDRAQIVDVRVGSHGSGASGYDRVVFEFEGEGIPEVTLRAGTPPFTQDPSGLPLEVGGNSFLVLVLHGATGISPEGVVTYDGPTEFSPGFRALTELKQAGDFEAVSEWVLGLEAASCHRLVVLENPTRLLIDVQHPEV